MNEKDIQREIERRIKEANDTPMPNSIRKELGLEVKKTVKEYLKEMDKLAEKLGYNSLHVPNTIYPLADLASKLSKAIPHGFKIKNAIDFNTTAKKHLDYVDMSIKKKITPIITEDKKYYKNTILPLIKKCSELFVDLRHDAETLEKLREEKRISKINKHSLENMKRNVILFNEAKNVSPEQFFLKNFQFKTMDIGVPKEFINTYYNLHEKLKERPLIRDGYLSADSYQDRIKGYYDKSFNYEDVNIPDVYHNKYLNEDYNQTLTELSNILFSNISNKMYEIKKVEYPENIGLYTYVYENYPEIREKIIKNFDFRKEYVYDTVNKYISYKSEYDKEFNDNCWKKYNSEYSKSLKWKYDKYVPLTLSKDILLKIISSRYSIEKTLTIYKDEILNLKKQAVNYNDNLNNINLKDMEEKENRAFNKVMHRKSMFDEGSAKLEAKGKNTSKILPLTRDDEGR